jgi:carbonic anhydrase
VRKLLRGIAEFRRTRAPGHAEAFARLATRQTPDALLLCCSDSRVAPNVFASVEPGDLLVVRNVGNLVPPYVETPDVRGGASVPAAIELAVRGLHVRDVIVCGHSECAAMRAIHSRRDLSDTPHLGAWLRHGAEALGRAASPPPGLPPHDHLSQRSVLLQLERLRGYPLVREAIDREGLRLHAWWFDLGRAEVLEHDAALDRFVALDEERLDRLVERVS